MTARRRIAILLCLALSNLGMGTEPDLAVTAARMLDVEKGLVVRDPFLVIEKGLIKDVATVRPSPDVEMIDLGDMTILPGLIDCHTHLVFTLGKGLQYTPVTKTTADFTIDGANNARKTLLAGFTTVRDMGSFDFIDVALMKASDRGMIHAPRIIPSGHGIGITGGHGDITGFIPGVLELGPREGVADGPEELLKAVRYQIKHGAKVVKVMATAGVLSFEGPVGAQQLSEEELVVIVEEARRHGLKVAAHAHGTEGIIAAIKAGVDSIEHGSMLSEEAIELMNGNRHVKGTHLGAEFGPTGACQAYMGPSCHLMHPIEIRAFASLDFSVAMSSVLCYLHSHKWSMHMPWRRFEWPYEQEPGRHHRCCYIDH